MSENSTTSESKFILPSGLIANIAWYNENKEELIQKYPKKCGQFCLISNSTIEFTCDEIEIDDEPAALIHFK